MFLSETKQATGEIFYPEPPDLYLESKCFKYLQLTFLALLAYMYEHTTDVLKLYHHNQFFTNLGDAGTYLEIQFTNYPLRYI